MCSQVIDGIVSGDCHRQRVLVQVVDDVFTVIDGIVSGDCHRQRLLVQVVDDVFTVIDCNVSAFECL